MAKGYFQFKQFKVAQDQCAMKVCTDACYFGAWLASLPDPECQVLDIGTGTGLLSLMLAQAWPKSTFLAVEIDPGAAKQATENFQNSPWSDRLKLMHTSIQEFSDTSQIDFPLIISNPPFYEDRLAGPDPKKNLAHHAEGLLQQDLLDALKKLLSPDGEAFLLYPPVEAITFLNLSLKSDLQAQVRSQLQDRPHSPLIRQILCLDRSQERIDPADITTIAVKNNEGQFSEDFSRLLKEYYTVF